MTDRPNNTWQTSSFCAKTDCVAVCRFDSGMVGITNTSNPERVLLFTPKAMAAWMCAIKAGALDD